MLRREKLVRYLDVLGLSIGYEINSILVIQDIRT